MKDKLFVQFRESVHRRAKDGFNYSRDLISNGFSVIYDEAKQMGDFIWIDGGGALPIIGIDGGSSLYTSSAGKFKYGYDMKLPIEQGTVYVSALFNRHLMQALCWSQMYPSINFVVGGPSAIRAFEFEHKGRLINDDLFANNLFNNLRVSAKLAEEELLGELTPRKTWSLDIPKELLQYSETIISYPIERNCYWDKCLFCNDNSHSGKFCNMRLNNSLDHLPTNETGLVVWLNSPSLYPDFIREELPKLPERDDISFMVYMRADDITLEAVETIEMPGNILIHLGIECPSNRQLKMMRKGVTTSQYLKFLKLLTKSKAKLLFFLMDGWNLIDEDIVEIEEFCREAASLGFMSVGIIRTLINSQSKFDAFHGILGNPELETVIMEEVGEFKQLAYTPVWSSETQRRNDEVLAIYDKYFGDDMTVKAKKMIYNVEK